jgi:hypothetical protein
LNTLTAKIVSVVLHPLLMPTYLFAIFFYFSPESINTDIMGLKVRLSLLSLIFIGTFLLPSLAVFYLHRMGFVKNLQLENLEERRLPYLITTLIYGYISYFLGVKMVQSTSLPPQIGIVLASITLSILVVGMVSLWWQISAHAVGISGLVGALLGILIKFGTESLFYPALASIIALGLVIAARLHLNAHTKAQVLWGTFLGLLISLTTVFYFI